MRSASENSPQQQLTAFLKDRRRRLAPRDVGLPNVHSRRTTGLRREDVAVLAGVGLTWYTWFEQGRPIQVSTGFLENVARALRLTDAERTYLFLLAQHRAPPLAGTPKVAVPTDLQPILDAITSPAYARTLRFDVTAWNVANTRMFGDFAAVPREHRNIIRLMFTVPAYRHAMTNWEADAQGLLAKFRVALAESNGAPEFTTLIDELADCSAEFRRLWHQHSLEVPVEGATHFTSKRGGASSFQHYTIVPEQDATMRIVLFIPAAGADAVPGAAKSLGLAG